MKNLTVLFMSVVISLIVGEVLVRSFTPFPINFASNLIPHDELLYVMDPKLPGVDRFGFRNTISPDGADVFAIGDSHTYGYNVKPEGTWPAQLARLTGLSVYNYGVGSYNIYQYFRLFEMAAGYRAKHVVIGLYPGNDFFFPCDILNLPYWRKRRAELGLSDAGCNGPPDAAPHLPTADAATAGEPFPARVKHFLKFNVGVISALDFLFWEPMQERRQQERRKTDYSGANAAANPDYLVVSRDHPEVNLWKPSLENSAENVDPANPAIRQHVANGKILFGRMKRMADRAGIDLKILVVPSKERVIQTWATRNGVETPEMLSTYAANETRLTDEFVAYLRSLAVQTVDANDALVALLGQGLSKGFEVYPFGDRHPYAPGYRVYAEVVAALFRRHRVEQVRTTVSP